MNLAKLNFDFGEINIEGEYTQSIEVKDGFDDIHYVGGSCFCTDVSAENGKINLKFTPKKSIGNLDKGKKLFKPVYVYIWLDKDLQEYIPGDGMKKVLNEGKRKITLPVNYMAVG